jgi:phosphate transport system permease protein
MILPTIISVSATSLKAVPEAYKDASLALGESITGTSYRVMLPAAKTGVFTAIVLGIGRAVGETMAVILVMGNTPRMPDFFNKGLAALFQPTRTLTGNIAIEMGYATGLHEGALFATATVLLVFIVIINLTLWWIQKKAGSVQ